MKNKIKPDILAKQIAEDLLEILDIIVFKVKEQDRRIKALEKKAKK